MKPFLLGVLTGAGFGAVLYKVGATRYSRVMGMLTLRDTKVMKFAFTAIGVASLGYGLAAALGVAESLSLVPRVMPFLGSAHLLGGALFGIGMGVSGLCPGTCAAKTGGRGGDRKYATPAAVAGLVAGVLLYAAARKAPGKTPRMSAARQRMSSVSRGTISIVRPRRCAPQPTAARIAPEKPRYPPCIVARRTRIPPAVPAAAQLHSPRIRSRAPRSGRSGS